MPPKQIEPLIKIVDISDSEDEDDNENELKNEIKPEQESKIIKTRVHHLVECPSCKKEITEHSLKFFHHKTCKGGHIQPERRKYTYKYKYKPPERETPPEQEQEQEQAEIISNDNRSKFINTMNQKKSCKNFNLFKRIYGNYQ